MNIKIEYIRGKLQECDCCGIYSSEGTSVYVDNELVWEKYSDGHMYGRQTEDSLLNCVVSAWLNKNLKETEDLHTEEARHEWNKNHPGNGIARTPESWGAYKNELMDYHRQSATEVTENCANLPYGEALQVKMIALWIEDKTGEKIEVEEEQVLDPADKDGFESDFVLDENWD